MRSSRAPVVVLLATLFLAAAAAGQNPSPTGNLYGTALDDQGKFLPGVTVTLAGPGAAQAAATDTRGDFRFLNLSPGDYVVALERTGLETARREVTVVLRKSYINPDIVFEFELVSHNSGIASGMSTCVSLLDSGRSPRHLADTRT